MQRSRTSSQLMYCLAFIGLVLTTQADAAPKASPIKMDSLMPETQTSSHYPPIDSLEMVGVGISVEAWRNHPDYPQFNLWQAVEASNGSYIISQDAKQYPKNLEEYQMAGSKRIGDAVDVAMRDFMDRYPLPIAVVGPAWHGADDEKERTIQRSDNAGSFVTTMWDAPYTARGEFAGLLTQSGQVMNSYLNDDPDLLWQTIFATFDQHGDIPAVGVAAKDGVVHGAVAYEISNRPLFDKLMAEQAYRPKQARTLSDNWTFITLVRRGRIEWLRPYAPLVEDNMVLKDYGGPDGLARNLSEFTGWKKTPLQPFVPTPFVAVPWTPFQIDQYDHLEHLGTLYRPQVVSYLDDAGKPVKAAERTLRMTAALRAALAPLNGKLPTRIIYDYGSVWSDSSSAARFLPLVQGLRAIDDAFDLLDAKRGYDLARILGDTGAGSPFVGVALASMAGRQSGGATLVANLRRNDGATLLLVTPPSAEQIKKDAAIKRPFFPDKSKAKKVY